MVSDGDQDGLLGNPVDFVIVSMMLQERMPLSVLEICIDLSFKCSIIGLTLRSCMR